MKVKILVEFEIESDEELFKKDAIGAASLAAWNNVCLTANGQDVTEEVEVHLDGFGKCKVKIGEEHQ